MLCFEKKMCFWMICILSVSNFLSGEGGRKLEFRSPFHKGPRHRDVDSKRAWTNHCGQKHKVLTFKNLRIIFSSLSSSVEKLSFGWNLEESKKKELNEWFWPATSCREIYTWTGQKNGLFCHRSNQWKTNFHMDGFLTWKSNIFQSNTFLSVSRPYLEEFWTILLNWKMQGF